MHVRRCGYGYGKEWVSECGCGWVGVGVRVEEILVKLTTHL